MKRCIIRLLSILLFCSSLISTRIVYAEEDQTDLASITTVEQDPVTGNLLITSENREWLNEIYALKNAGYDWSKTIYFSTGDRINYNNRWSPVVFESDDEGICGITITHDALLYHEVASGDTVITFPATDSFESFSLELQDLDACMEMTDSVAVHMDDEKNLIIEVDDCAWAEALATWDSNMKDINNHISLDSSSAHFDIWSDGYSFIYENGIVTVQNYELVSRGVSDGIYDLVFHVYGYVPYRLDADLSISGIIKERTAELSVTAETGDLVITCNDADFLDGIMRYHERYSDENGNQIRCVPGGRVNIDLENGGAELRNDRGHRPDGSTWENNSFHRDGNTIVVYNETLKNWGNLYDTDSARVRVHSYGYSEETINNVIIRNVRSADSPSVSVVQDEDTHDLLITSGNRQWLNEMYELSLDRPGGSSLSDFSFSTGQIITYTGRYSDNFTNIVYTRDQDGVNGITIKYNALLDSNVESGNSTLFLPRTASFPGISIEIENLVACEDAPENVQVHLDENNNLIITPGDSQWADRLVNWDGYGDFTNHIDLVGSGSYDYMIKINKYYATLEENQITVPEYLLVSAAIPDGIYDLDFYLYGYAVLHLDADIEVTGIMKELREEVSVTAENGDLVITCDDEDFLEGIGKYTEYYNQTQKRIPGGFIDVFIQNPDNSSGYLYSAYAPFSNVKTYDDGGTYERTELSRVNNSVVVSNKRLKTTNLHNTDSARVEIHAYGYQPVVIENVIIRNVRRTDVPDDVSVTIDASGDFIINSQKNKDWLEKLCEYTVEPDYSSFGKIILLQFDERNQRYEQKGQLIYYFYYFDGEKVVLEADKLIHSGIPSGTYRLKFAAEGYMDLDTELEITIVGTKEKPDDIAVRLDENGDLIIYSENGEDEEYLVNIAKQGSYDGNEPIEVGGEVILKNNNVQEWISNARQPGMIVYDEENNITRVRFSVYKFPYLSGNHIVSIFSAGYGSVYKANNDFINLEIFLPFINESFATNLIVGDSVQYTVNTDKNISWSTDDVDVASVDENGLLTAKKAGTVHLNMQVEGYEFVDSLEITISKKEVQLNLDYADVYNLEQTYELPDHASYDETSEISIEDVDVLYEGTNEGNEYRSDAFPLQAGRYRVTWAIKEENEAVCGSGVAEFDVLLPEYSIFYDLNGGHLEEDVTNPESYNYLSDRITLNNPARTGYTFTGWTGTDLDAPSLSLTIPSGSTGNREYVAGFEANHYTIAFNPNTGNGDPYEQEFVYDEVQELLENRFTKSRHVFYGWSLSEDGEVIYGDKQQVTNLSPVNDDVINLYAIWDNEKFAITYGNTLESDENPNPEYYIYDENDVITLQNAFRNGYNFLGWFTLDGTNGKWGTQVKTIKRNLEEPVTVYAKWSPIKYTIKYVLNGGTNDKANKTSYTVETCFDLTDPVKKGYAFLGWTDQYGNAVTTTEGRYENLTLTATFASEPTQYEIVLDPMGGTLAAKQSYDARLTLQDDGTYTGSYNVTDTTYKLPKLVKDFYKFNGWYDHETEKKVSSIAKGSIGNKDLYANFTPVSYKITYKTNGGKILVKNTKAEKFYDTTFSIETESLDLPVSEEVYRKGYIFKGWYLDKELTVPYVSIEDLELRNTAIYAKWEPITYRIQFVSDQYESEPVTIQYDQSYRLPDDIFHVPGMKVQKYTYMLNGKTVTVAANKTIKNLVSENGTDTIVFRVAKDSNQNELWDIYSPDGKKLPIKNRFGEKVYTYCNTQIPAALGAPVLTNAQIDELIAMVDSQRGLSPEEVDISVLDEVAARITTLADAACYLQRAKFSFTNKGLDNADIFGPDVGNIGFSNDEFLYTIPGAESLLVNEGQCSSTSSLMEYLLHGDYDELGYIKISQNDNGHAMIYILSGDKYYLVDPTEYVYRGGGLWLRFLNADKAASQSLEELVSIIHYANYPTPKEPNIKTLAYVYDGVFCMSGENGWMNDPGVNIKLPEGAQVKAFIGFDHPVFAEPQHSTSQSMILGVILR